MNALIRTCFIIVLSIYSMCISFRYISSQSEYRIITFDSGQGDSSLIQLGENNILIDMGTKEFDILSKLDDYIDFDNRKIDLLVLTHPHTDHYGGISRLLLAYAVDKVVYRNYCEASKVVDFALQSKTNFDFENRIVFSLNDAELYIYAVSNEKSKEGCYISIDGNYNNDSLIVLFKFENKQYIFWGDLEIPYTDKVVDAIKKDGLVLEFIYWKAGHHCSDTSTNETTFNEISVGLIGCSVGLSNKYNHPSSSVLTLFKLKKIKYLVTYEAGDIVIPLIE